MAATITSMSEWVAAGEIRSIPLDSEEVVMERVRRGEYRGELYEALEKATWEVHYCKASIANSPDRAAKLQARLDAGVFIGGARKGEPLSAQRRQKLEKDRDGWFKYRDRCVAKLPGLEAELVRIREKAGKEGITFSLRGRIVEE